MNIECCVGSIHHSSGNMNMRDGGLLKTSGWSLGQPYESVIAQRKCARFLFESAAGQKILMIRHSQVDEDRQKCVCIDTKALNQTSSHTET